MIQEMFTQKIDRRRQWHYRRKIGPITWWLIFLAFAEALVIWWLFL